MMTYNEIVEFARENYPNFIECFSTVDYELEIARGTVFTKEYLLEEFEKDKAFYLDLHADLFE